MRRTWILALVAAATATASTWAGKFTIRFWVENGTDKILSAQILRNGKPEKLKLIAPGARVTLSSHEKVPSGKTQRHRYGLVFRPLLPAGTQLTWSRRHRFEYQRTGDKDPGCSEAGDVTVEGDAPLRLEGARARRVDFDWEFADKPVDKLACAALFRVLPAEAPPR
jgi:hypothetical protein